MSGQVRIEGKLFVSTRSGRYGDFNIAKLRLPIGDFVVKDKWIDQFEPGAYSGSFEIGKIFNKTIDLRSGGTLTELRARIDDFALLDDGDVPEDIAIGANEQDPIVEEASHPEADADTPTTKPDTQSLSEDAPTASEESEEDLFGELWPLGSLVKLDPATDRGRFRKQKDYLKAAGYKYIPGEKSWQLQAE